MTNKNVLTDEEIIDIGYQSHSIEHGIGVYLLPITFARAIEKAILQSDKMQELRKDAEMFQYLLGEAWFQTAFDRFDPDDGGSQSKFELECRRILNTEMEQENGK